jgi:hypothetical protein
VDAANAAKGKAQLAQLRIQALAAEGVELERQRVIE